MALFFGFYLGSILMIILYNLHWFNVTKEKSYLYYSALKFFVILVVLQNAEIVVTNSFFLILSVVILLVFIFLFAQEFLNLKKYYKKINTVITYVMFFLPLCFIYCAIVDDYSVFDQPYSLMLSPLIFVGCFVYKKGFKPAMYYIVAWGISLSLVGVGDMNRFEVINFYPAVPFDLIGHIIESVILSYAIFVKTNLLIKEKEQQRQLLTHQAKLASMGQMLENIAHQWRQPLNRIATYFINMQVYLKGKYKYEEYLMEALNQSQLQLEHMSNTINDFTRFNIQVGEREEFFASVVIEDVCKIVGDTLAQNNIECKLSVINDFSIVSYPSELGQVILNLVQNAQDSLLERRVVDPYVKVIVNENCISIEDNGGGIAGDVLDSIFEPYFTTKKQGASLGLGLYMSKVILDKHFDAKIEVESTKQCTVFRVLFT